MAKPTVLHPEQEADTLISDLLFRLHTQERALRALDFLALDGRFGVGVKLELEVDCLSALLSVLEAHTAETLRMADRLEAVMTRAQWPKAA